MNYGLNKKLGLFKRAAKRYCHKLRKLEYALCVLLF